MCVFPISALFRIFYLIYKYFTEAIDNICIIIFVQYLLQLQFNLVENKSLDDGDIWRHQVNWEKWSRLLSLHSMCSSGGWLTAKWEMNRIGNILYLWSGPHRWFLVFCFFLVWFQICEFRFFTCVTYIGKKRDLQTHKPIPKLVSPFWDPVSTLATDKCRVRICTLWFLPPVLLWSCLFGCLVVASVSSNYENPRDY